MLEQVTACTLVLGPEAHDECTCPERDKELGMRRQNVLRVSYQESINLGFKLKSAFDKNLHLPMVNILHNVHPVPISHPIYTHTDEAIPVTSYGGAGSLHHCSHA